MTHLDGRPVTWSIDLLPFFVSTGQVDKRIPSKKKEPSETSACRFPVCPVMKKTTLEIAFALLAFKRSFCLEISVEFTFANSDRKL